MFDYLKVNGSFISSALEMHLCYTLRGLTQYNSIKRIRFIKYKYATSSNSNYQQTISNKILSWEFKNKSDDDNRRIIERHNSVDVI